MFNAVKSLYVHGMLDDAGVGQAVEKGLISRDDFAAITGHIYQSSGG